MQRQLLRNPDILPTAEVLERELGKTYSVFRQFINTIESEEFSFTPEWRFYEDGKAWLCKITFKKKTVVWLSAWSGCFKLAFYFTEKSGEGIEDLDIRESLKEDYKSHKPIGRLKPLVADIKTKSQLSDIYTLLRYKAGMK